MKISSEAVDAAARASFHFIKEQPWEAADLDEADMFRDAARKALEAAAPYMLGDPQAQAIEDVLIDFGRESVFLTAAQESMARFLRARVAELRSK